MRVRVQVGLLRRGKEVRIRQAVRLLGHGADKILLSSVETGRDEKSLYRASLTSFRGWAVVFLGVALRG
jgi:hypothetical protein